MFQDRLRDWGGEFVATRFDDPTSTWMFVGIHSTVLGPGFGGTRIKVYPTPEDALRDVLRLSSAMTFKNSLAEIPFGGGKSVLAVPAVPTGEERRRLLERYADLVTSLGGSYVTACDMNTRDVDMDVIAERCAFVMGRTEAGGGSGSSAPDTALGVFQGIAAALEHAFGSRSPEGRIVVLQGAGAVGSRLAELLADAGATVMVSDVDEERAKAVADRTGGKVVPPDEDFDTPCDIFSPCATGAVLNEQTIPRLRCRIVAGAANNQLAAPEDADRLAKAGILYAPDYVVNAGGVLHLAGLERLGWKPEQVRGRIAGIGETLGRVLALAESEGITTEAAASRLANARIDRARLMSSGPVDPEAAGDRG
jgi:leucine dehydrogenase